MNREQAKAARQEQMDHLTVETCMGNVFQADEASQARMVITLRAMENDLPDGEVDWIMADNSVVCITMAELEEALGLAVEAKQSIWII
jgi:hypothetical protein